MGSICCLCVGTYEKHTVQERDNSRTSNTSSVQLHKPAVLTMYRSHSQYLERSLNTPKTWLLPQLLSVRLRSLASPQLTCVVEVFTVEEARLKCLRMFFIYILSSHDMDTTGQAYLSSSSRSGVLMRPCNTLSAV